MTRPRENLEYDLNEILLTIRCAFAPIIFKADIDPDFQDRSDYRGIGIKDRKEWLRYQAVVETVLMGSLLNYRKLDEFFYSANRDDDLRASSYGFEKQEFLTKDEKLELNKRISHLTTRMTDYEVYMWAMETIARKTAVRTTMFLDHLIKEFDVRDEYIRRDIAETRALVEECRELVEQIVTLIKARRRLTLFQDCGVNLSLQPPQSPWRDRLRRKFASRPLAHVQVVSAQPLNQGVRRSFAKDISARDMSRPSVLVRFVIGFVYATRFKMRDMSWAEIPDIL